MDGWEVAKHAREIDPNSPIIYMTGAGADQWPSHGVPNSLLSDQAVRAKPSFVTAVCQLLNGGTATT